MDQHEDLSTHNDLVKGPSLDSVKGLLLTCDKDVQSDFKTELECKDIPAEMKPDIEELEQIMKELEEEHPTKGTREGKISGDEDPKFECRDTSDGSDSEFTKKRPKSPNKTDEPEDLCIGTSTDNAAERLPKKPRISLEAAEEIPNHSFNEKYIGRYTVSVDQLKTPPKKLLVRPVCRPHIEEIKKQLVSQRCKLVTALPCMINPELVTEKENFKESDIKQYVLFTLGGNHIRSACQDLLNKGSLSEVQKRVDVDLYAGLSTSEARRLANIHNLQAETLPLSFTDMVRQARRLLFEKSGLDEDGDTPSTAPSNFVRLLQAEMAMEHKATGALTTVIHVARYSKECWELFTSVADRIEQTGDTPRRLKQTIFQCFQGLNEERIRYLLTKVNQGSLSLKQAGVEARTMKIMDNIKSAFVLCTGSETWLSATERYPGYTSEEKLAQFIPVFRSLAGKTGGRRCKRGEPGIPVPFVKYCNSAQSEDLDGITVDIQISYKGEDVSNDPLVQSIIAKYRKKIIQEILEDKVLCESLNINVTKADSDV